MRKYKLWCVGDTPVISIPTPLQRLFSDIYVLPRKDGSFLVYNYQVDGAIECRRRILHSNNKKEKVYYYIKLPIYLKDNVGKEYTVRIRQLCDQKAVLEYTPI